MRVIVFFDLPTETAEEKGEYRRFRKFLLAAGFIMMQESVYCKLVMNTSMEAGVMESVRKNRPKSGIVQMMSVTEKQFQNIECITGEFKSEILNSDERLVVI